MIVTQNEEKITVIKLHYTINHYMSTESRIKQLMRGFKTIPDLEAEKIAFTILLCEDNSAFIRNIENDPNEPKSTLYPPPSAELIKKIVYSARLQRFIVLLSSSTLCVYKRQKETALLEKMQESHELKDSENKKALGQGVTCMELIYTHSRKEVRPFDTEILQQKQHELFNGEACQDKHPNQEFLIFGLGKGSVVFVHIGHLDKVYCRFTVHRDAIKVLKYLPKTQTYLSFCQEHNLKIWRLNNKDKKITIIHDFKISPDRKINNVLLINSEFQLEQS